MGDYDSFQWGAARFPLGLGSSLLDDADPALSEVLGFFSGIIGIHLGTRWDADVVTAGKPDLVGNIVASTAPYDPVPVFEEAQFQLPLLAVYRMDGKVSQRTVERSQDVAHWGADWILPPLTPAQLERLYPFLRAAAVVIVDRCDYGFDPGYDSGRQVFADGGISRLAVTSYELTWLRNRGPGTGAGGANTYNAAFPTLHLELEVAEQRLVTGDPNPGGGTVGGLFEPLGEVAVTVQNVNVDDPGNPVTVVDIDEIP